MSTSPWVVVLVVNVQLTPNTVATSAGEFLVGKFGRSLYMRIRCTEVEVSMEHSLFGKGCKGVAVIRECARAVPAGYWSCPLTKPASAFNSKPRTPSARPCSFEPRFSRHLRGRSFCPTCIFLMPEPGQFSWSA